MNARYDHTGRLMTDAEAAAWDAEVDATAAAIRAERQAAEQPPAEAAPPPVDMRALARQIRNGTADSNSRPDIQEIAKRIRGPF
ncbi:hypothetical protein [Micromonospora arida]|uniref:Uncharacterized protein n=1 Tax=Micromonospora arida TaxID=2203715 RepID=A0A3N9XNE0_9ACTN|nr:hypothetical protein [Micromonospora arida]RQX14648.1 hypothetical protein DLJ58_01065 [Micromonospora arida]